MSQRRHTPTDLLVNQFDQALRTVFGAPLVTGRANPAAQKTEADLTDEQRDHTARLMRINHTGEVCAQALYQGQALTAKDTKTREAMEQSAAEENDHLAWCEQRVNELGGRLSLLNPLWYASSFLIGATAGAVGDKWSLGFVAETEKQVENHLQSHLDEVGEDDERTRAILEQMKADEIEHGKKAMHHGGVDLPSPILKLMRVASFIMTKTTYRI